MIAVVAVVAVIVVGAVAMTAGDDDTKDTDKVPTYDETQGDLKVYGNANNDLVLDDKDVKYIQDAIENKVARTPFCDANNDGNIDEKDVQQVRDMLAKKDGTKVWYVNGFDKPASVDWPIKSIVVTATFFDLQSTHAMAIAIGLDDSKVIAYNKGDPILFQAFSKANVLQSNNIADVDEMTRFGVPDVIVTGNHSESLQDQSLMDVYTKLGVDVICTPGLDGNNAPSAGLTLGYLVDCEKQSKRFYDAASGVLNDIAEKLKQVPESKRKTALVWFGAHGAAGYDHIHSQPMLIAGGKPIADWSGWKKLNTSEFTWFLKYDPDIVFRTYTIGYSDDAQKGIDIYKKYGEIIDVMDVYKRGDYYLVDSTVPPAWRAAYMAEILYPDVFGDGYGDKWHQQLIDLYGLDVKADGQFVVTYEEAVGHPPAAA